VAVVSHLDHPRYLLLGHSEEDEVVPPGSEQEEMGIGVSPKLLNALSGKLGRNELVEDPHDEVAYLSLLAGLHQTVLQRELHSPLPHFNFLS
jgi:hypothetical protein